MNVLAAFCCIEYFVVNLLNLKQHQEDAFVKILDRINQESRIYCVFKLLQAAEIEQVVTVTS